MTLISYIFFTILGEG